MSYNRRLRSGESSASHRISWIKLDGFLSDPEGWKNIPSLANKRLLKPCPQCDTYHLFRLRTNPVFTIWAECLHSTAYPLPNLSHTHWNWITPRNVPYPASDEHRMTAAVFLDCLYPKCAWLGSKFTVLYLETSTQKREFESEITYGLRENKTEQKELHDPLLLFQNHI